MHTKTIKNFAISTILHNFASVVRNAEAPVRGKAGGMYKIATADALAKILIRKRLLDALSWLVETWKTSIGVK